MYERIGRASTLARIFPEMETLLHIPKKFATFNVQLADSFRYRQGSLYVRKTDDFGMVMQMETTMNAAGRVSPMMQYEYIDSKELAARWALPESWIREQVRSRQADPLPHVRFGKYVRFRWGSPELEGWAERRIIDASNRTTGRFLGKETQ